MKSKCYHVAAYVIMYDEMQEQTCFFRNTLSPKLKSFSICI